MITKPGLFMTVAVFAVLLCSGELFAWGPATHVEIGSRILENLSLLPAGLAAILAQHRRSYLYGNIAADVVFAKRWSRVKQCCHHWSTAFALLTDAEDEADQAFGYGYLSHLAADTIAHGKFVPRQVLASNCSVNFGHFYWELRGDALQGDRTWAEVQKLVASEHDRHHASLENHITDTFLTYDMNRLLFGRMNAFAVRKGFRRSIGVWSRFSRYELPHALMGGYVDECVDRVQAVLTAGARSAVLKEDPNGTSALMQLRVRRRESRRMRRLGLSVARRRGEAAAGLLPEIGGEARSQRREPVAKEVSLPAGDRGSAAMKDGLANRP